MAASGRPPTRQEIASAFSFRSVNAAESHLRALERKGFIAINEGVARGISLVDEGPEGQGDSLPVIGRVAAGLPILAQEHVEDRFEVDPRVFKGRADYLLRVHGESMVDAGIRDGDLVAVQRTAEARDGQIVIARIDDEVAVKRLAKQGRYASLLSANAAFAPIVVDLSRDALVIEGVVVGLLRTGL